MGELLSGGEGDGRTQGVGTPDTAGTGMLRLTRPEPTLSVSEALDGDLDAYLDRELFVGAEQASKAPGAAAASAMSKELRGLLDLAEAESEWLETLPAPTPTEQQERPEPIEPEVVIPEWMRVAPGEALAALPEPTIAHSLNEPALAGLPWGSAAGTDASGMPMTPWSVPATPLPLPGNIPPPSIAMHGGGVAGVPMQSGGALPGLMSPPGMAQPGGLMPGMLPPPGIVAGPRSHGRMLPGIPTPPPSGNVPGMPVAPWAPPMANLQQQPWGPPMAPVEPKRILGMKPGSFLGAAAVGALAAGLLVVAGLRYQEQRVSAHTASSTRTVAQGSGPQGTVPGGVSAAGVSAPGAGSNVAQALGASAPLPQGVEGTTSQLAGAATVSPLTGAGATGSQFTGTASPHAGVAATGSQLTGAASPLMGAANGSGTVNGSQPLTGAADSLTGTAHGPQPFTGTVAGGTSQATGMHQAAASVSGTVLSTANADVRGAANGLQAPASTPEPVKGPAVASAALTSGKTGTVKKATAKAGGVLSARSGSGATASRATTDESPLTQSSELSFDESESATDGDTEDATTPAKQVKVSADQARPPDEYSELDEDFARELGFTDDAASKEVADPRASRTVYIPPAPDAKQHLTPDDVKQVVVANQPAVTACIRQHAKGTAVEGGGRFTLKWSVLPSGDTSTVSMDTDTLRATPLARCLEDVVRRWKFPPHQVRMQEPVRFPFVF